MNTLVSPSQIFCEKCQQMVKCLLNAVEKKQNQLEEDELYEKTIDFLHSNLYLLRDMKMISGFAYLIWILVDFRIYDNSYEKRKQITKELEDIIETLLELAENEDIILCTSLRRMQIYFSMSAVYSKLKPVANVILIEQCYLEAESIVKFVNEISESEKKQILDLWETIKTSHELRNIHSVVKEKHSNNGTVNYISCDPFEGGSLYAPSLKRKETPEISYKPRRRRRHRLHKKVEDVEISNDDSVLEASADIKFENVKMEEEKKEMTEIRDPEILNKTHEVMMVNENKIEAKVCEEDHKTIIIENGNMQGNELLFDESNHQESSDEEIISEINKSDNSDDDENGEPPEIPTSEPPELNYEPVFSPYSYITNSSLRNPPLFHPIMLPRDPTKGILPPLKIDPPAPQQTTKDIPVIVRNVIAELNEKTGGNVRPFERTVKPITNLERTTFSLKEIDSDEEYF